MLYRGDTSAVRRRHDIYPQTYLTQLLTNLPLTTHRDPYAWLPDRWKPDQKVRLPNLQSNAAPA